MSKELKYYHNNKHIINLKRKLKYQLQNNQISQVEFDLLLNKANNKLNTKTINEELLSEIFESLDDCFYSDLIVVENQIKELKKRIINK